MKFSELENISAWIGADNGGDTIKLDGNFSIDELKRIIKYMEEYQEGNEDL